jgi:succinoglycan biosynthesis transport protein ExoP
MELRHYLYLFRKWIWLLILGGILGGAAGYYLSTRQPEVYQTNTRIMVMRSPDERPLDYVGVYSDIQLAKTYSQLISTGPVLEALSEKLGYTVYGGQINAKQIPESFLLEVTVRDGNPTRAADIANSLVEVFVQYNEALLKDRFSSSEESLQAQITQLENQISSMQDEMSKISEENLKTQQQQVEEQIAALESEMDTLRRDITTLTPPTPQPTQFSEIRFNAEGTALPTITPLPSATPDQANLALLADKQRQLDQLQSRYDLYQQIYLNLVVLGEANTSGSQNLRQSQIQTTLTLYQQIYSNLLNSYENVRLARLRSTPNVVQIEPAVVPGSPIQPQPIRNTLIGVAAGLLAMGVLAFVIEYLDDTIKTPEDVNRVLNLPVIGLIGEMQTQRGVKPGVFVDENPRSPIAEAFRTLRTNLEFASINHPLRSLLVTSANPSEGKTTVAVNLAVAIAQGDRKVIMVDADLRRPSTHKQLSVPNRTGLSEVFRNQIELETALIPWHDLPMKVLTSGSLPPNPAELLGSERMTKLLLDMEAVADMVIIDSPPFIVADPITLAAKVDGVLLVLEPGGTKIDSAKAMFEQLQRAGARVIGVVMNPITRRKAGYYSGRYRYYSDYYYSRSYSYYGTQSNTRPTGKREKTAPRPGSLPDRKSSTR